MIALRKLQQNFTQYLTGNSDNIIEQVVDQGKIDRSTRLNIYQNAYYVRLKHCIETDHPMLGLYLGDDLFEQMVTEYVAQYPSHTPSLRQFGNRLPDYLAGNAPFKDFPIIAEIATFERTLMEAFDAADSTLIDETKLKELPAEQWPDMKLTFHPSVHVLTMQWNSVESWQALKNGNTPPKAQAQPTCWIIWRDRDRLTQYRALSIDGFVLYQCFNDDYPFAEACELLKEHLPDDHIGPACVNHLQSWFNLGMVSALYS